MSAFATPLGDDGGQLEETKLVSRVKQITRVELRRLATRKACISLLEEMISGQIEVYVGYRRLYRYWCGHNSAVQELRPMFSIPGLEPDGILSVTEGFNAQIASIAREILTSFGV